MITRAKVEAFVEAGRKFPILDVRSPGEFANGHIPGAHLFSLFDNEERAEIGTLFKQVGQLEAITRGMDIIGPKVGKMFAEGIALVKDGKILVHCWRGGKRSEAVAGLLNVAGMHVILLEGGYKQFRNWVLQQFKKPWPFLVVGGKTGSGKTDILHALGAMGENIVDLEELADHRGSAFGRLGATRDVTLPQFENDIAWNLTALKPGMIWLEDESRNLGGLQIQNDLWIQKVSAPMFMVELPRKVRMERLMKDYGNFSKTELEGAIMRLQKRLGGLRTTETVQALHAGDSEKVMDILLEYYDKSYFHPTEERKSRKVIPMAFDHFDAEEIAARLIEESKQLII